MNQTTCVIEILKWKSKSGVTDAEMIASVNAMLADLRTLSGFIHQSLYKNSSNEWVDVYYWETEADAHNSNSSMANKPSFIKLIKIIEPESVSVDVMPSLQASGDIAIR